MIKLAEDSIPLKGGLKVPFADQRCNWSKKEKVSNAELVQP